MPVMYNTSHRSRKRVFLMIATVWVLAFAVSCPLLFGFNTTGEVASFTPKVTAKVAQSWDVLAV